MENKLMEKQNENIVSNFPAPRNHAEVILHMFHLNKITSPNVKNSQACSKCLIPWNLGNFSLKIRSSNPKRIARRSHKIERYQAEIKSKKLKPKEVKSISRKVKRLQQQNNHVALYKCLLCGESTKVQLRKKIKEKCCTNKSESVTAAMITSTTKHNIEHDSNPTKVKDKRKKKKKTAGLLIPPKINTGSTSLMTTQKNLTKIAQLLKQHNNKDESKQKVGLSQFFK